MEKDSLLPSHHAFLIVTKSGNSLQSLTDFLARKHEFNCSLNNPDYWQKDLETFGIEDSRELKENHLRKAAGKEGKKIFVIKTDFMTGEAQNALLKVVEEPQPETYFFFILPSKENLLPTLLSRLIQIGLRDNNLYVEKYEQKDESSDIVDANLFLSLSTPARLKALSDIIDNKDKGKAISFLDELESVYRKKVNLKDMTGKDVEAFEIINKSRDYLNSPSSSIKIILENIALVVSKKS